MRSRNSYQVRSRIASSFAVVILLLGTGFNSLAQLQVADTLTNNMLAELLVGGGVTISNVNVTCPTGAYGEFDGSNSNLGLPQGIMLTTGAINLAVGPNNLGNAGQDNFSPSTGYLTQLAGLPTFDACVFEFDVLPKGDTLRFPYVFGSEEYMEFVNIGFNDVFAFTIDGPNPAGGNYINQNIALIPGTATPVTIDNVNNFVNGGYYFDNEFPPGQSIQYDGFTVNLVAEIPVIPCQSYHLRLQIADAGDGIYDSGVFIEKLSSPSVSLDYDTELGFRHAIEGCNDIILQFSQNFTSQDTTRIAIQLAGTATSGTDYSPLPSEIQIPPDSTTTTINVTVFTDTLNEGVETLILRHFNNPCDSTLYDSIFIQIFDEVSVTVSNDTTVCAGTSVQLGVSGAVSYQWAPAGTLDSTNIQYPVASPLTTTTYMVRGIVGICPPDTEYVTLTVLPQPIVDAGTDTTICMGNPITLPANSSDTIISWTPGNFLDDDSILNPTANISATTVFNLNVSNGVCSTTDQITITVEDTFSIFAVPSPDTLVCAGDPVLVAAQGAWTYDWSPANVLTSTNTPITTANVANTTTLTVVGMQSACPNDTATIVINMLPIPTISGMNDTILCQGDLMTMNAFSTDTIVSWSPTTGLSDPFILNPQVTTSTTSQYTLTVSNGVCSTSDSITITVIDSFEVTVSPDIIDICNGQGIPLNAFGATSYTWSPATGLDATTISNPNASPTDSVIYTVIGNVGTCPPDTATITVNVLDVPTVEGGPDGAICTGESFQIMGSSSLPLVTWTPSAGLSDASIVNPVATPANTTTYTVVANNGVCSVEDSLTVTVVFMAAPNAGDDQDLCSEEVTTIGDTGLAGTTYVWSPVTGLNDPTSPNPTFSSPANTGASAITLTYTLIATDATGCVREDTINLTIYNEFSVDAGPDQEIVFGESTFITGTGGTICEWRDINQVAFASTCETIVSPTATTTYIFVGGNDIGCATFDSVTVAVVFGDAIALPSGFTPNGDGSNDFFHPIIRGPYQVDEFKVFNRWGEMVYYSTNTDCSTEESVVGCRWDGEYKGKPQPIGTYTWYINAIHRATNERVNPSGTVTLIR